MTSETVLSDKEWRQMRRQMSKLDFEPVPETPALLPQSLYNESDEELASICEVEKLEEVRESAALGSDDVPNRHDSPRNRSVTKTSDSKIDELSQPGNSTKKDTGSAELPSTSMAVSPLLTRRYQPREQKRPPESNLELDDTELAALDAQMTAAQDATRRSVMRVFIDLKAKIARAEALERMKLSAAHTIDVKILQNRVDELKGQVARAEAQREQRELLLDRFLEFTAKQSHLYHEHWSGESSLIACFHAWNDMTRQKTAKRCALRRVLAQSVKRQQLASFSYWKESARGCLLQKRLQDQRDRYEQRIVDMAKEYQLKIQQLQHEIDDAKYQVAEAQKCRQKLEEDLRLIFLRGVSAMNIEALTAFGSSHKQNRKLDKQDRSVLPSRQETKSNQIAESGKTNLTPSRPLDPEVMAPLKEPTPSTSPETSVPAPIVVEDSAAVSSTPSHARVSVVRSSYSQAPPYLKRAANGWSRVSNTTGLRSAEMIRQQELFPGTGHQSVNQSASSYSAPSAMKKKSSSQLSTKNQVEMQYMRSTVAASAARATCTRSVSVSRFHHRLVGE